MGKRRKPIEFNEQRLFYSIKEVADHLQSMYPYSVIGKKSLIISTLKRHGWNRQYTERYSTN